MFKIPSITLVAVMTLGASAASSDPDASAGRLRQSNTDLSNQCGEPYDPGGEL